MKLSIRPASGGERQNGVAMVAGGKLDAYQVASGTIMVREAPTASHPPIVEWVAV